MRVTKTGWYVIVCAVVGVALLLLGVNWEKRETKLADGSILRLEKIYYGKPKQFVFGGLLGEVKTKLPKSWIARFSKPPTNGSVAGPTSWYNISPVHTNEDALYIYITRRDAGTGAAQNVGFTIAQIVDEHGCVFQDTQAGGEDDGRLAKLVGTAGMVCSVTWFRFEAFPRHQKKFLVRFFPDASYQSDPCEFTISNPARDTIPRKNWVAKSFSIKATEGDVSFILANVTFQTNDDHGRYRNHLIPPQKIVPTYEVIEAGHASSNWQALDSELYDSTGNFSSNPWYTSQFLCPRVEMWKLRTRFFGNEKALSASNVAWTLRGLDVPRKASSRT